MLRSISTLIALTFLMAPSYLNAESGPDITWLLPTTAERLGFSVDVLDESGGTLVTMKGPRVGPNGCPAARIGSATFVLKTEEPFVTSAYVQESAGEPTAHVSYGPLASRVSVWIDYLCSGETTGKATRYAVRSVDLFR